jgi:hypothetical protein
MLLNRQSRKQKVTGMSNEQIEGVPYGWRLVRIGYPKAGEWFMDEDDGRPGVSSNDWNRGVRVIIKRIEQEKQYRQFANAAEFEPHRDRWVEYTSPNYGDCSMYLVSAYTSERVWLGPDNVGKTYKEAFHCLRFDDGSPFGVEVTE